MGFEISSNEKGIKDFSLWCDFIEREFLERDFSALLSQGKFVGATSNPSIFASAIGNSSAYKNALEKLKGKSAKEKYEELAIADIALAADKLEPLYRANKDCGFISIEIDPLLCDDVGASVSEGRRLYEAIAKENVMIKVPATQAGYAIMSELAKAGIHINATLVFSQEQARECARVLDKNLCGEARGVISVFVSRFDSVVDTSAQAMAIKSCFVESFVKELDFLDSANLAKSANCANLTDSASLANVAKNLSCPALGVLNAFACYGEIEEVGNPRIRTLFASTGAKLDGLSKDYYITNLLVPHSVNTAPLSTIEAFWECANKHGGCKRIFSPLLRQNAKQDALDFIAKLNLGGKSLSQIQNTLLENGLQAFKEAFCQMLKGLE
ncbi:transaldolase family protein [Helicobacter sp. T3_23-1056]